MKNKTLIFLFIASLLFMGCEKKSTMNEEIHQVYRNDETVKIMMIYPTLSIDFLDQSIEDMMNLLVEEVSVSGGEVNVSYELNQGETVTSLALFIKHNEREFTQTYHLDENYKLINFEDVFDYSKIQQLSKLIDERLRVSEELAGANLNYRKGIIPTIENFMNFHLGKETIDFYFSDHQCFDDYKTHTASFTYDELEPYLLINDTTPVLLTYDELLYEPVKLINPNQPMIALTFDDGPNKYTDLLLDALLEHRASATFFVLGSMVDKFPNTLQRMVLEGNEIGNHTMDHKQLTKLSEAEILREVEDTQDAIESIVHIKPTLVRPPYGERNASITNCLDYDLILWDIDTRDWTSKDSKRIVEATLTNVRDGDIILMHDIYATSVQAAIELIPLLQEKGYQLVTVSELLLYRK